MDQQVPLVVEKKYSKKFIGLICTAIGCVLAGISIFWYIYQTKGNNISYHLDSPVVAAEQAIDSSKYHPGSTQVKFNQAFDISAASYAVMDRDTHEILFASNMKQKLPIASLTKIMTAVVALEFAPLDSLVTISANAVGVGEASMGLTAGERLTIEELLYGAMLPSGNDAAEALAEGVGLYFQTEHKMDLDRVSARTWFISQMNEKGKKIGLSNTRFFNPTGLDEETIQQSSYSTVYDMMVITNYALGIPTFSKIVGTKSYTIPFKQNYHKAFFLENILQLSQVYTGIKGVKPGYSYFALETLSSYIERDGKRLIAVFLGSQRTKDDALVIYKRIFQN